MMEENIRNQEMKKILATKDKDKKKTRSFYIDKGKGILSSFVTVFTSIISAVCVQLLERTIPDLELNTLRCSTAAIFCTLKLLYSKELPVIPKENIISTMRFILTSFVLAICLYTSVTFVSLSMAQSLNTTFNLVSGMVLFAIFCKERVTMARILFAFTCRIGVILVLQPRIIFKQYHASVNNNETMETLTSGSSTPTSNQNQLLVALGITLASATGIAVSLNTLVLKTNNFVRDKITNVLFWDFILSSVASVVMAIFENPVLPENWFEVTMVAGHCLAYVFLWPSCMYSSRFISANTMTIIYSTTVVFMLLPQYTVLSSILPGNKNWIEVVGVVLVLTGSGMGSVLEIWTNKNTDDSM